MIEEIVVYNVKPERLDGFQPLLASLQAEIRSESGFVSWHHLIDVDDPQRRIDRIAWDSLENAKKAHRNFSKLDACGPFLEAIDGRPLVEGHYQCS